jgi:adenylosuccinate lyase
MPHKVNPIDFENAEGNLGVANALLRHFAEKLPLSRWQRPHRLHRAAQPRRGARPHADRLEFLGRGLAKIEADAGRMAQDLAGAWEVLGEAVQTVLRATGVPDGYERLKEFTRGRAIDAATLGAFIDALPLPAGEKARLRALTPAQYTGLAAQLARGV